MQRAVLTQNVVLGTSPPPQRTSTATRLSQQMSTYVLRQTGRSSAGADKAKRGKGEKAQLIRTTGTATGIQPHGAPPEQKEAPPGARRFLHASAALLDTALSTDPQLSPGHGTSSHSPTGRAPLSTDPQLSPGHGTSRHGPTGRAPLSTGPQLSPGPVSCLTRATQ